MTYKELLDELQQLTEDQLATEVLVYIRGAWEFHPVCDAVYVSTQEDKDGNIIETNHPYLMI